MKPRSEAATPAERLRYAAIKSLPCAACRQIGIYAGRSDVQHITDSGRRISNLDTYGLCKWHHQGYLPVGCKTTTEATEKYGPSFAKSKRAFEERFGTEEFLLAETNRYLGLQANADFA